MFKLNLKIALRNLWKNKGLFSINVLGLGIGIASCILLLLYVVYEWGYDRQFTNADKSYVVYTNRISEGEITSSDWTAIPMANDLKNKFAGVNYAAHFLAPNKMLVTVGENSFKKEAVFADPDFLKILDYKLVKGDSNQLLKEPNTIVLTQTLAKQLFGDENPIGKSLKIRNNELLTVNGVIEDVPTNSTIQFEYLLPWSFLEGMNSYYKNGNWDGISCLTLIQLKNNDYKTAIDTYLKDVFEKNGRGEVGEGLLHPLTKWHLYSDFKGGKAVGGKIDQLKILFFLAICTLLIACANFMNLSTAQSEKRAKEVVIRKTLGSKKRSLIYQFITESLVISICSAIIGLILTELSLPYFNNLLEINIEIDYSLWQFWGAFLLVAIITGLISGSYPAFYLSSFEPLQVLKGFKINGKSSLSIRKLLVVFQFTFTICLIVAVIIVFQQLNYIKNKPIGYDRNNLVQVPLNGKVAKYELLKQELLNANLVTNVTAFSGTGITGNYNGSLGIAWPGKPKNTQIIFNWAGAGYDFTKTMGIKIIAGRDFDKQFNDSANVLINEAAVKVMGLKNPVGTVITWDDQPRTIVGVMQNFLTESPYTQHKPLIMFNAKINDIGYALCRLNPSNNLSSTLEKFDAIVKSMNPIYPVDRKFINDEFNQKLKDEATLGALSNWFGGFAIFISGLGLFGLALFMAEQRNKEMSIRKVLGADSISILTLMNKDFVKLVLVANVIALPLSYYVANKWLAKFEYNVGIDMIPFIIAAILSLLIAVFTVSFQSYKLIKSNPINSLKYE